MTTTEIITEESGDTTNLPQPRKKSKNRAHLFKKGESGNPNGRPKGSKNKLTLLREAVIAEAEENLLENWTKIVDTTITLANAGDTTCLKIVWDRMLPAKRAIEEKTGTEDKLNITLIVKGMEVKDDSPVDAEFVEVVDGD